MKNTISIIIPVYKVDLKYFGECLLSVKNQTFRDFEVYVIFDGAEKYIVDYYNKIIGNDKRFKSIVRDNKGVSYTRNQGIDLVNTKWISFVDADDWLELDALDFFYKKIENIEDVDFVIMKNYRNYKDKQVVIETGIACDCFFRKKEIIDLFQSSYGSKRGKIKYCNSVWKNFYKTSFLKNNHIRFDTDLQIAEDMLFNFDVWRFSKQGYYINYPIYHYRYNDDSIMNSKIELLIEKYNDVYPRFYKKIELLDFECSKNHQLFIIRQIERYAIAIRKDNFKCFKKKISNLLKNNFYYDAIKKSNLFELSTKHMIFLLFLKINFIFGLYYIVKIRKMK